MSLRVREVAVPLISKVRNKHAYFKYLWTYSAPYYQADSIIIEF